MLTLTRATALTGKETSMSITHIVPGLNAKEMAKRTRMLMPLPEPIKVSFSSPAEFSLSLMAIRAFALLMQDEGDQQTVDVIVAMLTRWRDETANEPALKCDNAECKTCYPNGRGDA